jgi:hypothetical protein
MVRRRRETAIRRCFWLTPGGFEDSRRTQKLQCDAHQLYRQWRHNYTFRESIVGSLISERDKGLCSYLCSTSIDGTGKLIAYF